MGPDGYRHVDHHDNPVNDAPVAVDDAITATEDTLFTSTVDLDFNDTDLDGDSLSVVAGTFATTQGGSLVLAADGSYTYTPALNFNGIDTVDYTVTDGMLTDIGTLTITVNPVNDAPVAVDDAVTATEDTLFTSTVDLDFNDTDLDGDSLSVVAGTYATTQGGSLVLAADGSYSYTPALNFHGIDSVVYTVTDGMLTDVGTLTITVNAANDAPTITAIANQTIAEDGTTGVLAFSVGDMETAVGSLTVSATSSNTTIIPDGNLTLIDLGSGNWTIEATPAANQTGGPVTITVTVDDGTTSTDETFTVTVTANNDAPTIGGSDAGEVTKNIDPDGDGLLEVAGVLTISDPDPAESSFQAGTVVGAYGSLTIDAAGNWNYAADNTQAVIQQLGTGESISDVLTVTTADGTTHSIIVTINGATATVDQGGDDPGPGPLVDPIEPDPEPEPELPPEEILPVEDELPPREELTILKSFFIETARDNTAAVGRSDLFRSHDFYVDNRQRVADRRRFIIGRGQHCQIPAAGAGITDNRKGRLKQ